MLDRNRKERNSTLGVKHSDKVGFFYLIITKFAENPTSDGRITFPCHLTLLTLDNKHYLLTFTWYFVIKDLVISRTVALSQHVDEVKDAK
jgi:hypothetical protein